MNILWVGLIGNTFTGCLIMYLYTILLIRSNDDGPFNLVKTFPSLDKRVRACLPGVDYHHCNLHSFRGVRLYERLGGNLQGIVPVFPNCFFPLPLPCFVIPNLQ